jgi:hypothetical protein
VTTLRKAVPLAVAAAVFCVAGPASADQTQGRQLTTTSTISLTITSSATVGVRSRTAGGQRLAAVVDPGAFQDSPAVSYMLHDSRGERALGSIAGLEAAMADSTARGERNIDVTFVF